MRKVKMTTQSLTRILPALLVAGTLLLPILRAAEGTLAADTYISSGAPASNFGTGSTLNIAPGNAALVSFDLSSIPAGAAVTQVYLRVFVNRVAIAGTLNYALITSPWSETGVTSGTAPTVGSTFGASPVNTGSSFILVDITAQAQNWLTNPATNFGMQITGAGSTAVFLDSKENAATSHPAALDIVMTGQPG
jgi:hypothetical protein